MMSGRRVLSRGFAALLSVCLFCGSASASFDDPATRALFRAALRGEAEELRKAVDEGALFVSSYRGCSYEVTGPTAIAAPATGGAYGFAVATVS